MGDFLDVEKRLEEKGFRYIAGTDEAGRGPLAGPVVAAACILLNRDVEKYSFLKEVDDSKKLTPKKRKILYEKLINSQDIVYSVSVIDSKIIDEINILQAAMLSMQKSVLSLKIKPGFVLVDGNILPDFKGLPGQALVKGDSKSISIAVASIIAKQYRDDIMEKYHQKWPCYGFLKHKGYGTKAHVEALKNHGPCEIHRRSFKPVSLFVHVHVASKNQKKLYLIGNILV